MAAKRGWPLVLEHLFSLTCLSGSRSGDLQRRSWCWKIALCTIPADGNTVGALWLTWIKFQWVRVLIRSGFCSRFRLIVSPRASAATETRTTRYMTILYLIKRSRTNLFCFLFFILLSINNHWKLIREFVIVSLHSTVMNNFINNIIQYHFYVFSTIYINFVN